MLPRPEIRLLKLHPELRRVGLLVAVLAGCSGGSNLEPGTDSGRPATVTVVSGGGQSGPVAQPLPDPIVVRVTDQAGLPVAGIAVSFTAATEAGAFSPPAERTNEAGEASAVWTLGPRAGAAAATAAAAQLPPIPISAAAVPGPPAELAFVQAPAGGVAGAPLSPAVRVEVEDAFGNVIPTSTARIQLRLRQGTLAGAAEGQAEAGIASFPDVHIDQAGQGYVLTAASDGLQGAETAAFDVVSGAAIRLEIAGGMGQSAPAGGAVPVAPTVVARDGAGNPVPGAGVTFTVMSGGGGVAPANVTTGADGHASLDSWILGETAGGNTLRAALDAAPAVSVQFTATGTPGPVDADRSSLTASPTAIASGESSAIRVIARDAFGNPVAGAAVRLSATGAGITLVQPPSTDGEGTAGGSLRAIGAGTRTVTAEAGGVTLTGTATIVVTEVGTVASVGMNPGSDTMLVGQTAHLVATPRDVQGVPVEGAAVTWSSSHPAIASVDANGTVTGLKPGAATITAQSGGQSGKADIAVSYGEGKGTGIPYCTMEGEVERLDVYVPAASFPRPLPVAVHVHGGGWVSGNRTRGVWFAEIRETLVERGYLVVSVDYRLAPEFKYPAQIRDVKCAVRHLRANALRYGLDPDRIGVFGASAGGQLVGLLGTTDAGAGFDDVGGFVGVSSRVQAVVAMSPITDLTATAELRDDYSREFPTWPLPESPELIEASPVTHVTGDDSPFFFVVGEDDTLVLPAQSVRMDGLLRGAGVTSSLLTVRHADHGLNPTTEPISPTMDEVLVRIAEFFDRHLR